jgi:hypothetical protein
MRFPLRVYLRPAVGVMAPVLVAHAAAGLALFHGSPPWSAFAADSQAWAGLEWFLAMVLLWSLVQALRGERAKGRLVLVLGEDGRIGLGDGEAVRLCRVRPGAADFGWAVWLSLEPVDESGEGGPLSLMLVEANLPAGQWRSFHIWLRHKADATAAPAV